MKEHLKNLPEPSGSCKVCEINLYKINNVEKPIILPCGIKGCPYERYKTNV